MESKMRCLKLLAAAACCLGLFLGPQQASSEAPDQWEAQLAEPLLQFGSSLMRTARKERENLILSPVSIQSAFNLVLLAAKSGSETEKELVKTLGYGSTKQCHQYHRAYAKLIEKFRQITEGQINKRQGARRPTPVVDLWTRIVAKEDGNGPRAEYLDAIGQHYNTSVALVPRNNLTAASSLAKEINGWASDAGFGAELVSGQELMQDFSLLLLSAIRLESRWLGQLVAQPADELFLTNQGQLVNGTALVGTDIEARYVRFSRELGEGSTSRRGLERLEFQAVSLALAGDISLVCLVPLRSGPERLVELEQELLRDGGLAEALRALDEPGAATVFKRLQLPKFGFELELNLVEPLRALGLAAPFEQQRAELDQMGHGGQFLSDAKHRALIEVNELGLRAAGATLIQAETLSDEPPSSSLELTIDEPFAFVVRLGRLPLFMGHLVHLA